MLASEYKRQIDKKEQILERFKEESRMLEYELNNLTFDANKNYILIDNPRVDEILARLNEIDLGIENIEEQVKELVRQRNIAKKWQFKTDLGTEVKENDLYREKEEVKQLKLEV